MSGLLMIATNEQLVAHEQQQAIKQETEMRSHLAKLVQETWQENKKAKEQITEILLQCTRQRNSEYDPSDLQAIKAIGGSEIYMGLTATKIRQGVAQIADIVLSPGEPAWDIEPTAIPELPGRYQMQIDNHAAQIEAQAQQQGIQIPPGVLETKKGEASAKVLEALRSAARKASEAMKRKIEDQMEEGCFDDVLMEVIEDFCTYPTAFLKGPEFRIKPDLQWGEQGEAIVSEKIVSEDRRVSPYDIYPAPNTDCLQRGRLIEVIRYQRDELYSCIGVDGYDEEAIRRVLRSTAYGRGTSWLDDNNASRLAAEGKTYQITQDNEIVALQMWGGVPGTTLLDIGIDVEDPDREYEIVTEYIDGEIIMVRFNKDPLKERPYYAASFQSVPGSIWGKCPPMLMRDIQRMGNATARALANNMGLSSGPQIFINIDSLPQGQPISTIEPNKIWQVVNNMGGGTQPPISFYQPSSNADELLNVYNTFESKADMATGIISFNPADQQMAGHPETAQGLAMRIESMTKGIKQAIRNLDLYVIRARIRRQYRDNMLYINDPAIKGDMDVKARGATALIGKAATHARRNEFLQMLGSGIDGGMIDPVRRIKLLRQIAEDMELDGVVPDELEIEQMQEQMKESQQQPQDPKVLVEQMRMDARLQDQQLEMQDHQADRESRERIAYFTYLARKESLDANERQQMKALEAKMGELAMKERNANERFMAEAQIKHQMGSGI